MTNSAVYINILINNIRHFFINNDISTIIYRIATGYIAVFVNHIILGIDSIFWFVSSSIQNKISHEWIYICMCITCVGTSIILFRRIYFLCLSIFFNRISNCILFYFVTRHGIRSNLLRCFISCYFISFGTITHKCKVIHKRIWIDRICM